MKSHALRNVRFVTRNVGMASQLLLAFAICFASIPAHAQGGSWQVDPQHSIARLSLGRGSNSVEIGVARVSGDVVFDPNDPADPSVNLKITSNDGLNSEPANMTFTSRRSATANDGNLVVTGDLSVTRIDRSVTMEPNEAYAGPQYGDPVTVTETRQITLLFPNPRKVAVDDGVMHFSGSTSVSREAFPELLDALTLVNWPTQLVTNKECHTALTIGEDYSGVNCTGTEIASVSNSVVPTGVAGGEGYDGFSPAVTPDRERATVALNLKLTQQAPHPSAASGAGASAGH